MNLKAHFQNFSWFQLWLQIVHDLYVFHCSDWLLCWIKSHWQNSLWKLLSFHPEMIVAKFLWASVLLRGESYYKMQRIQILQIFRVFYIQWLSQQWGKTHLFKDFLWNANPFELHILLVCPPPTLNKVLDTRLLKMAIT